MTRRYRATTFSIAVAGALAIAACSTDYDGAAMVCTEVTLYCVLIIRSISTSCVNNLNRYCPEPGAAMSTSASHFPDLSFFQTVV
jgi:hypothetical protein